MTKEKNRMKWIKGKIGLMNQPENKPTPEFKTRYKGTVHQISRNVANPEVT